MRSPARRRALGLLLVLVALFASPGAASAASAGASGWTFFTTNASCVWTWPEMRDDRGKPWVQTHVFYDYYAGGDNTTAGADHSRNIYAGWLSVRQDLIVWNPNENGWQICNEGNWYANQTESHVVVTTFAWSSRPCFWGRHYYVRGKGSVWSNNAFAFGWQGRANSINTPVLYL